MQKQAKVNSGQMRENDWLHSNVSDRLMPRIISCPAPPSPPPTSTTHHSTSMEAIDKAIASLEAHRPVVKGQLKKTAEKYGVNRSTLGRRWRGRTGSRKETPPTTGVGAGEVYRRARGEWASSYA
jgi:hypothetical protein